MPTGKDYIKQYQDRLDIDQELSLKYYQEIDKKMQESTAIYKGEVIPYLFQPLFYTIKDVKRFEYIAKIMNSIINKSVKRYLNDDEFRRLFNFTPSMEKLILIDPGYSSPAPISRFDLFYNYSDEYKFCELNGDGSSAMNESNTLEEIFTNSSLFKDFYNNTRYYELFESWYHELLNIYREFGGEEKHPNIAIVDFAGLGTSEEFKRFKLTFEKLGSKTVIADPRELEYRDNHLYYQDFKIDLIYRRAVNKEIDNRLSDVKELLSAYENRDVCVVGPFRSEIMHNKIFFAILHNEVTKEFLTAEEIEFIKLHIPLTEVLSKSNLTFVKENKDIMVLKPMNLYSARGVHIGLDFTQERWCELVNESLEIGDYLYQEFCVPAPKVVTYIEEGEPVHAQFNSTLGLFNYNNNFAGLYSRLGRENGISALSEVFTAPNIIID